MLADKLKIGDTIGIICPSNCIDDDDIEIIKNSENFLKKQGFNIKYSKNCFANTTGYGATAIEKAEDINQMYIDKDIKAILSLKGGFNSNSVFDYLDLKAIKENNKIICGYSDATSYINYIVDKTGNIGFIGPNFKTLTSSSTNYCYNNFINHVKEVQKNLLEDDDESIIINKGTAKGKSIGGNLSLISELADTLNFEGKILFLEELYLETPPAMASNYLYNLKQKGIFSKIKGLWIGNYDGEIPLEKIITDIIRDLNINIPIIKTNNFGHTDRIMTIPLNVEVVIENGRIKIVEDYLK